MADKKTVEVGPGKHFPRLGQGKNKNDQRKKKKDHGGREWTK